MKVDIGAAEAGGVFAGEAADSRVVWAGTVVVETRVGVKLPGGEGLGEVGCGDGRRDNLPERVVLPVLLDGAGRIDASEKSSLKCPESLPEAMPKGFPVLVELAEKLNRQVTAGEVSSIQTTLEEHGLWSRGHVMDVHLGFSSLGGITSIRVDLAPNAAPSEREKWIGIGRDPRTGEIRGFSQMNALWDGIAEVTVRSGTIVSYQEGYVEIDEQSGKKSSFGRVGLQVEWSNDGAIVREEYLKERKPFKLNLNPNRKKTLP